MSIHGEFSSADASALTEANSRITLYPDGSKTELTALVATAKFFISEIFINVEAALTVTIYDGSDTTVSGGETIVKAKFDANGGLQKVFQMPYECQVGTYPKVKTSGAGQVYVYIRGFTRG